MLADNYDSFSSVLMNKYKNVKDEQMQLRQSVVLKILI